MALFPGQGRQAEAFGQGQMAAVGGRGHKDIAAAPQAQPGGHGVGGPARAQQQGIRIFQGRVRQRGQKAAHIGIVAAEGCSVPVEGVDRAGQFRLRADAVQQGQEGHFVRNGHRTPLDAQQAHTVHKGGQALRRHFPAQIDRRNAQGLKAGVVQQRRKALSQGPACHPVKIDGQKRFWRMPRHGMHAFRIAYRACAGKKTPGPYRGLWS